MEDQQATPPTILISGAKSLLTKALVFLAPFLNQTNTITALSTRLLVEMHNNDQTLQPVLIEIIKDTLDNRLPDPAINFTLKCFTQHSTLLQAAPLQDR